MRAIRSDVGHEALAWNAAGHATHMETFLGITHLHIIYLSTYAQNSTFL